MSGFRMSNTNPNKAREESEQLEPTKLIFLFAEGVRTEINYFNQLAKYHSCQDRDLRVFDRWKVNTGHSNQYLLTKNIEEYIEKVNNGKEKEVEMAKNAGLQICTLGKRILRCETAPLCGLSAVMYASGEF